MRARSALGGGERGIALALTLFALVVVGILVGAAFVVGLQEQRIGQSMYGREQAFGAAETAIAAKLRAWPRREGGGDPSAIDGVHRVDADLFLIDATGMAGGSQRARVGLLVELVRPALDIRTAVRTADQSGPGSATASGGDSIPPGWQDCPPPPPPPPPPAGRGDSTTGSGSEVGSDLAADSLEADVTLPSGTYHPGPAIVGGRCDTAQPTNWGDGLEPGRPCHAYRPTVRIAGPATITGGQGQGILLVAGDLSVSGGFQFSGIVMVQGTLTAEATDSGAVGFWGGVVARRVHGPQTFVYSKCAIDNALAAAARPKPLPSRAWGELYSWP